MVIDIIPLIKRYELGDSMTPDEKELLTAGLYFFYRAYDKLKSAVDTIPAALMLVGGQPYRLTFTEACLREIEESQK